MLKEKLQNLEQSQKFSCWYLVKHTTNFTQLCYLVKILSDYKNLKPDQNLQDYIKSQILNLKFIKSELELTDNYRSLRVAAAFGLIKMHSDKYQDATLTDVFLKIQELCKGEFEKIETYSFIIQSQIEKLFIASVIDEENFGARNSFSVFPAVCLLKVLIEIGELSGKYEISLNEFRYLVSTTKKYEDISKTIILISELRQHPEINNVLKGYRGKFDSRINKALEQLRYFNFSEENISLRDEYISSAKEKIKFYETHKYPIVGDEYIDFLCSLDTMFENKNVSFNINTISKNVLPASILQISEEIEAEEEKSVDEGQYDAELCEKIIQLNKKNLEKALNQDQNLLVKLNWISLKRHLKARLKPKRSRLLAEYAKIKAQYKDQVDGGDTFVDTTKHNYVEAHHIIPFGKNKGPDIFENLICLSPHNHALIHHGSKTVVKQFYEKARKNNVITLDQFIKMCVDYKCLSKKHVDQLLKYCVISQNEAKKLNSLIDVYGCITEVK